MIRIHTALNSAEAHLVAQALEAQGIATTIRGSESLQGIGEPIAVWLQNPGDEARAKAVLEEFSTGGADMEERHVARPARPKANAGLLQGLIIGLIVGVALSHYYPREEAELEPPASADRNGDGKADAWYEYVDGELVMELYDQNQDGRADTWYRYEKGFASSIEVDRNHDGKADEWALYDDTGALEEARYDMDFDGDPDHWEKYESGLARTYRSDNDGDGKIDEWGTVERGQIVERNWSFRGDGTVDKVALYRNGLKYEESFDRNRDGVFEEKKAYDEFEREITPESSP